MSLVSVIIPVYNRPELLRDAVASVASQSHRPIELIIVDDGSTDHTPEVARSLAQELNSHDFKTLVLQQSNAGPGMARQLGLDSANGEFVQFLDSDDLLEPSKLEKQLAGLQNNPKAGVSYCVQQFCSMDGTLLEAAWMRSGEHHTSMFPAMLAGRLWGTPVPLYRKTLLDQVGPWSSLSSQEDWEYDCRVAAMGTQLHYLAETLVTIRSHAGHHFGDVSSTDAARKLKDRAAAYESIHQQAMKAKIAPDSEPFYIFRKMSFHLVRQCGAAGLNNSAKHLFNTVNRPHLGLNKAGIVQASYYLLALVFGWKSLGRCSEYLDQRRVR